MHSITTVLMCSRPYYQPYYQPYYKPAVLQASRTTSQPYYRPADTRHQVRLPPSSPETQFPQTKPKEPNRIVAFPNSLLRIVFSFLCIIQCCCPKKIASTPAKDDVHHSRGNEVSIAASSDVNRRGFDDALL